MDYSQFTDYADIPHDYRLEGIKRPSIRFGQNQHLKRLRDEYVASIKKQREDNEFDTEAAKIASLEELRYLRRQRPGDYRYVNGVWEYDDSKEKRFWEAADHVARRVERDWRDYRPNQYWDESFQRRRKARDMREQWLREYEAKQRAERVNKAIAMQAAWKAKYAASRKDRVKAIWLKAKLATAKINREEFKDALKREKSRKLFKKYKKRF